MEHIFDELAAVFGPEAIGSFLAKALPDLIIAAITLGIFYVLWRLVAKVFKSVSMRTLWPPTIGLS